MSPSKQACAPGWKLGSLKVDGRRRGHVGDAGEGRLRIGRSRLSGVVDRRDVARKLAFERPLQLAERPGEEEGQREDEGRRDRDEGEEQREGAQSPAPGGSGGAELRPDRLHARRQRGIGAEPARQRHPARVQIVLLTDEGGLVDLAVVLRPGRENQKPAPRALRIARKSGAPAVAGELAGARIGRAEEGHDPARQRQEVPVQMVGPQMADLVADDHVPRGQIVPAGVEEIRVEDDEAAPEELGGEGVETAVGLHEIGVRRRGEPGAGGELDDPCVEIGKLVGPELDGAAPDMGDERGMREEDEDRDQRHVDEADPERPDDDRDPQRDRDDDHRDEKGHLARPAFDADPLFRRSDGPDFHRNQPLCIIANS